MQAGLDIRLSKNKLFWWPGKRIQNVITASFLCIFSSVAKLDANQNQRREKVKDLIAYAEKCCQEGVAFDVGRAAFTTSLNMLSNTFFSVDLADLSQDSAKELNDLVVSMAVEAGKPNLVDYFPVLAKIDPQGIVR